MFILTANEHILTEFWLQIVEVAIISVGMSVQWLTYWLCSLFYHLVMNVSLFNTSAFTVVSAYIIDNKSFCCVVGFDIIQPYHPRLIHSCDLSTSRSHATICRLDLSWNKKPNSLTSCSAHFISIEGSSVRLGYSRNIPHSVLLVLVLGISCGFTTA